MTSYWLILAAANLSVGLPVVAGLCGLNAIVSTVLGWFPSDDE